MIPARLVLALGAVVMLGCGDRAQPSRAPLGEVLQVSGTVERTAEPTTGAPERWAAARTGDSLDAGAGVRTGDPGGARVRVADSVLRLGANAAIRIGGGDVPSLAVEAGEAEIEAGDAEIVVDTAAGPARLRAGSVVRVRRDDTGAYLVVEVGVAVIERDAEPELVVEAGDAVTIDLKGALRARADAGPDGAPDAGIVERVADEPERMELPGGAIVIQPAGARADVTLAAGDSCIIHDPAPPTFVRLDLAPLCGAGEAAVELRRGRGVLRHRGAGSVVATLARGSFSYRATCAGGAAAEGTVRVVRDAGRRRVAVRAPDNEVEADGRRYQLLYQNRAPNITFTWPGAPDADAFVLVVEREGAQPATYKAKQARRRLRSGALREGTYQWWFEVAGAGAVRSQVTTLVIDFDNAAPAAELREPAQGDPWRGDTVRVKGVAIEGATVSVGATPIELDRHFRFDQPVPRPDDGEALAVRIAHPERGVHYYVRRRAPR